MSNKVGNKVFLTKEIQLIHFNSNYTKIKSHSNNDGDNNYNIKNNIGNENLWLDNLKGLE